MYINIYKTTLGYMTLLMSQVIIIIEALSHLSWAGTLNTIFELRQMTNYGIIFMLFSHITCLF